MATPLDLLGNISLPQATLAICHSANDADYLNLIAARGFDSWARTAGLTQIARPWPEARQYDAVILPLPANRETLSLCLAASCSNLATDGILYLFGHNDTGIKSADRTLKTYFNDVELLGIGGHGRLYAARQPLRGDYTLDELRQTKDKLISYPGLFAKGRLDTATAFLLEHLPELIPGAKVLDFACGIGAISKTVQLKQPDAKLTLVDNDALALAAAALNLPDASRHCLATPAVISGSYDLIVSNPPIHDGQTLSYAIVEQLIAELPRLLTPQGDCYIVAQVTVPIAKMATQNKMAATEVAATKSFRVTKLSR